MLALLGWLLRAQSVESTQARMDATRELVEVVHGIAGAAQAEEASGAMTRDAAQR